MSHLKSFVLDSSKRLEENSDVAKLAKEYLLGRGLSHDSIRGHEIGLSPLYENIPEQIKHLGQDPESDNAKDFSYFIADKIIVPIKDEFNILVGFATRSYRPDGTTWWNTPFAKGNHLFLLGQSKASIFKSEKIYLVEGYIDALILNQMGLKNVVSIMGTNLSLRHIALILRYCTNVCFCLDTDKNNSGQKGQCIGISRLNRFKSFDSISAINMPVGVDPDEFVLDKGLDEFLKMEKILSEKDIRKMVKQAEEFQK